jgi:hypothetical protein
VRRHKREDPIEDVALLDLLLEAIAHGRGERTQVCPDFNPHRDSLSMTMKMESVDGIEQAALFTVRFDPGEGRLTLTVELRDE